LKNGLNRLDQSSVSDSLLKTGAVTDFTGNCLWRDENTSKQETPSIKCWQCRRFYMKRIEETSPKNDLLMAIIAALELAITLSSWPLGIRGVLFVVFWSVFLGIEGTIAVLKYKGTIQVREPSPESIVSSQRYKALFMMVVVAIVLLLLAWCSV
jgi:hypothetical protein